MSKKQRGYPLADCQKQAKKQTCIYAAGGGGKFWCFSQRFPHKKQLKGTMVHAPGKMDEDQGYETDMMWHDAVDGT